MVLAGVSIAATSLLVSAELPPLWSGIVSTAGLLADSGVATTLLLRTLLCFVDGEHSLALRAHLAGLNRSTWWFDVRSNSGTLQAAVVWVALSFALLLFAGVLMFGEALTAGRVQSQYAAGAEVGAHIE